METKVSLQEKQDILKKSSLWKYLLLDKEIRYTDLFIFFIERYNYNPFSKEINGDSVLYREKSHTDLWINKNIYVPNGETSATIERPHMLIENKLKSLPYKQQLQNYTKTFLKEYISSIKKELSVVPPVGKNKNKRILEELHNCKHMLKFYLLTPLDGKDIPVTVKMSDFIYGDDSEMEFTWIHVSYSQIGEIIKTHISGKDPDFVNLLFEDFANVLRGMTIFMDELNKFSTTQELLDRFNPKGIFDKFENMHSLYAKYTASQCADKLNDSFNKKSILSNWSFKIFNKSDTSYIVNHSYSNNKGLFEVAKKVSDNVIYAIQYQDKVIKKALVIKTGSAYLYEKWFEKDWGLRKFRCKPEKNLIKVIKEPGDSNEKYYKYAVGEGYTFYYSVYDIVKKDTIEEIIALMNKHIDDNVPIIP